MGPPWAKKIKIGVEVFSPPESRFKWVKNYKIINEKLKKVVVHLSEPELKPAAQNAFFGQLSILWVLYEPRMYRYKRKIQKLKLKFNTQP